MSTETFMTEYAELTQPNQCIVKNEFGAGRAQHHPRIQNKSAFKKWYERHGFLVSRRGELRFLPHL
jgi:hypothetical protein